MGKGRNRWGTWGVVKKNTGPPKQGFLVGGELWSFQQEESRSSSLGRPEPSGVEGGRRSRVGVGRLFGNWGEGTALPAGSPSPSGLAGGAACNPHGQVWGCQMWGLEGAHKGLPSGRLSSAAPSFSARVHESLSLCRSSLLVIHA